MKDLGFKFNRNTLALVVSDIHLGALHTKKSYFDLFLSSVCYDFEHDRLPNLRTVVILGDFFDLIMDTHKDLLQFKPFNNILTNLDKLYQKETIDLVITPGNHEIPVVDDYDANFKKEKSNLLEDFKTAQTQSNRKNLDCDFLFLKKPEVFPQYAILSNDDDKTTNLDLFDTKIEISNNNPIKNIPLNVVIDTPQSNNLLMTHGYQFDPRRNLFAGIWKLGLKKTGKIIKTIGNAIWNGVLHKIYRKGKRLLDFGNGDQEKLKGVIEKTTDKYIKKGKAYNLSNTDKENIKENVNIKYQSDMKREEIKTNEPFISTITENFLPDLYDRGYPNRINHVIYGHTHYKVFSALRDILRRERKETEQYQTQVEPELSISNTGAWQHVLKPSFIEIRTDMKVYPGFVPLQTKKVEKIINRSI